MFPIQSSGVQGELREIPWALIQAHEAQALNNHCGQSLERLAQRQGLSACEAVAILEDMTYPQRWAMIASRGQSYKNEAAEALKTLVSNFK